MSKRSRIEITIFRRTIVRHDSSCASPTRQRQRFDDKDAPHQGCDDSSPAEELDRAPDQPRDLFQAEKRAQVESLSRRLRALQGERK